MRGDSGPDENAAYAPLTHELHLDLSNGTRSLRASGGGGTRGAAMSYRELRNFKEIMATLGPGQTETTVKHAATTHSRQTYTPDESALAEIQSQRALRWSSASNAETRPAHARRPTED